MLKQQNHLISILHRNFPLFTEVELYCVHTPMFPHQVVRHVAAGVV